MNVRDCPAGTSTLCISSSLHPDIFTATHRNDTLADLQEAALAGDTELVEILANEARWLDASEAEIATAQRAARDWLARH